MLIGGRIGGTRGFWGCVKELIKVIHSQLEQSWVERDYGVVVLLTCTTAGVNSFNRFSDKSSSDIEELINVRSSIEAIWFLDRSSRLRALEND